VYSVENPEAPAGKADGNAADGNVCEYPAITGYPGSGSAFGSGSGSICGTSADGSSGGNRRG
jgi:hypothetical protein